MVIHDSVSTQQVLINKLTFCINIDPQATQMTWKIDFLLNENFFIISIKIQSTPRQLPTSAKCSESQRTTQR